MLPGYRERFCEVFGEDSWRIKDEWSHYHRIATLLVRDLHGQPPSTQFLGWAYVRQVNLDCGVELLNRVSGMTLSIRQIEMFRADPDDLPEFLLTLHHQFGQQSDLLRVAKIGTQTVRVMG
ncbi:MAG: hypothetical protein CM15mP68_4830 [Pseudomonadota bacterium]|nr:MAG: hypothetical protein CM15mP68_4830 [Pseudomonadota bacterium]